MSVFLEGDHVDYLGDGLDGIPPAQGKIVAFASQSTAYVEWLNGPRAKQIDMVSKFDLEKSASETVVRAPEITAISVRRAMNVEGVPGVLQFLAAAQQLGTWERIAREALGYVEGRLRVDDSMELPYEQLQPEEIDQVITTAARTLLRDMFGEVAS